MPRGQGFRDGGEDVRLFKTAALSGRVIPRPQLLVRSALSECRLVRDPAGNSKIAKAGEGKRRRGRDDPGLFDCLGRSRGDALRGPRPRRRRRRYGTRPAGCALSTRAQRRAVYGSRRWRALRLQVLEAAGYLCQCPDCTRDGLTMGAELVHHIEPWDAIWG